ncbi:MAG: AsmA family [Pseudomonadota bacterium]|jgi:hypothetical protein
MNDPEQDLSDDDHMGRLVRVEWREPASLSRAVNLNPWKDELLNDEVNLRNQRERRTRGPSLHLAAHATTPYHPPTMKKKIIVTLLSLFILLAAGAGVVVYKLNEIVSGFRPQIEQQLSAALGAKVHLGEISASLFPSCHLSVKGVKVLAADGKAAALSLGGLTASVALRPLLSKKLDISNLEIERPRVTLIKDATGTTVQGLPQSTPGSQPNEPRQSTPATSQGGSSSAPIDVAVSRVTITDGEITIDDRIASTRTPIRSINLDAGLSLQGRDIQIPSLKLSFAAASLPPIRFTGSKITFGQDSGALSIGSFDTSTDMGTVHTEGSLDTKTQSGALTVSTSGIDLRKAATILKTSAPAVAAINPSGLIVASIAVTLAGGHPSLKGPVTLKGINADLPGTQKVRGLSGEIAVQGALTDLSLSAPGLQLSFQDAPLRVATAARLTSSNVTIQSLTINGLGGEARLPATLQLAPPKNFTAQPSLSTISIGELLKVTKPSLSNMISGTIVSSKGSFSGSTMGDVAHSVNGQGDILVKDAVLKGVNLPALILSKVSNIPLLEGSLRSNIPPEHQKHFNDPDTKISDLKSEYSLSSGVITLKSLRVASVAFTLESNGTISMDGDLNLASNFILAADISASIAKRSNTVEKMLNKNKLLEIPVVIKGRSPMLVVAPDISKLLQGAGGKMLEEKAGSLLEKALGGKKGADGKQKNPLGGLFGIK